MKRFLFLDFETFSSADIKSVGSFKYMEAPDFQIMLLAWAFDDDPVQVEDLITEGIWPTEFLDALTDPEVIKVAHNAVFERYAIRQELGIYSPPEQWFDTMHLVAQCGLPMSLDGAGQALGLPEDQAKMKEGKALIRYFCQPCKPTKTNGLRTRNLPEHAPEKWLTFMDYCQRDVEAERTIFKLLRQWAPNREEKAFWNLDARINEKGVRIDRQLAVNAVAMDQRYKEELTARAVEITGLENPKSVSQIKNWLKDALSDEAETPATETPAPVDQTEKSAPKRDFKAEYEQLQALYPDVKQLPDEVVRVATEKDIHLLNAYLAYRDQQSTKTAASLKKENAILKQNAASAAKAPVKGVSGGGATPKKYDPALAGFDSYNW